MGATLPTGGSLSGNFLNGPGGARSYVSGGQNGFFDFTPGRFIVKVEAGIFTFSGANDAGGYFYIPLIPEGGPWTATAIDTETGQTRSVEIIGPPIGESTFVYFDFLSEEPFEPTIQWDGGGDGTSWHDPLNWDGDTLPGPTDQVLIDMPGNITVTHTPASGLNEIFRLESREAIAISGGTLAISGTSQISNTLALSGGILRGMGDLTVLGAINWTGGTMQDIAGTLVHGPTTISGTAVKSLNGRILANFGTAVWRDAGNISGGGTILNQAGATFEAQSDATFSGTFTNVGMFSKSAGPGTTFIQGDLNNNGIVNIQSGTLWLRSGSATEGTFQLESGAVLDFSLVATTYSLDSSSLITGTGNVIFSSGIADIAGGYQIAGDTAVSGGTANFNGTAPVTMPNLFITGGTLGGSAEITVTNVLSWTLGTMTGPGSTNVLTDLFISGPSTKFLSGRTLSNFGTAVWSAGNIWASAGGGGTFNNRAGASLNVQGDNIFVASPGFGTLNNDGTLSKSVGTGTTRIDGVFNNSGTVAIQSGTMTLRGGGSSSGAFNMTANTVLNLGRAYTMSSNSAVIGPAATVNVTSGPANILGMYNVEVTSINGATINFDSNDPIIIPTLNLSGGGTVAGSSNITVTNNISWTGGTMSGAGHTISNGTLEIAQLPGSGGKTLNTRMLINNGLATWSSLGGSPGTNRIIGVNGATVINSSGATFDIVDDGELIFGSGQRPTFINEGALIKSGGNGNTNVQFDFTNAGTVEAQTGTMQFNFFTVYSQTMGTTLLNGGNFVINGGAEFNIQGGLLAGIGTIGGNVVNNGGQVMPGGLTAAGTLTITGNYTQAMTGTLHIELGGLNPGIEHDQLIVQSAVTLDGLLDVHLLGPFVPMPNDNFVVLTYGTRPGNTTFATINGNSQTYLANYNLNNLTLMAQ